MTSPNGLPPRKCRLKECAQEFQPITSWQEFHSPRCRNRYAWLERKRGMQLVREQRIKV